MPFDAEAYSPVNDDLAMTPTRHVASALTAASALALWDSAQCSADRQRAGAAMAHVLREQLETPRTKSKAKGPIPLTEILSSPPKAKTALGRFMVTWTDNSDTLVTGVVWHSGKPDTRWAAAFQAADRLRRMRSRHAYAETLGRLPGRIEIICGVHRDSPDFLRLLAVRPMPAVRAILCENTGEIFEPGAPFGAGDESETIRLIERLSTWTPPVPRPPPPPKPLIVTARAAAPVVNLEPGDKVVIDPDAAGRIEREARAAVKTAEAEQDAAIREQRAINQGEDYEGWRAAGERARIARQKAAQARSDGPGCAALTLRPYAHHGEALVLYTATRQDIRYWRLERSDGAYLRVTVDALPSLRHALTSI